MDGPTDIPSSIQSRGLATTVGLNNDSTLIFICFFFLSIPLCLPEILKKIKRGKVSRLSFFSFLILYILFSIFLFLEIIVFLLSCFSSRKFSLAACAHFSQIVFVGKKKLSYFPCFCYFCSHSRLSKLVAVDGLFLSFQRSRIHFVANLIRCWLKYDNCNCKSNVLWNWNP